VDVGLNSELRKVTLAEELVVRRYTGRNLLHQRLPWLRIDERDPQLSCSSYATHARAFWPAVFKVAAAPTPKYI